MSAKDRGILKLTSRYHRCVKCGFCAQTEFDFLVLVREGYAHRQCAKGKN